MASPFPPCPTCEGPLRWLLRVAPLDLVPDVYDIPPLCASWELVGKLDD